MHNKANIFSSIFQEHKNYKRHTIGGRLFDGIIKGEQNLSLMRD